MICSVSEFMPVRVNSTSSGKREGLIEQNRFNSNKEASNSVRSFIKLKARSKEFGRAETEPEIMS